MQVFKLLKKYENNIAVIDENFNYYTYKNIFDLNKIKFKEIVSNKLIFILADNNTEFISCYLCFLERKLVQALIDPQIDNAFLDKLIEIYKPEYLFIHSSKKIFMKNYDIFIKLEKHYILKKTKNISYSINPELRLMLTTSGTTGSKKFVRISDNNIFSNTKSIIKYLHINQKHRSITTMPPFYTYGLSIINTHLFAGGSILVTKKRVIEKEFWKLFDKFKVTSFGGVPFFYEMLLRLNFQKMDFKTLKYFTQAGGPLQPEIIKYFYNYAKKNKKKFIVMYGQVEATSRISYLNFKYLKNKIGSIGKEIPGGKMFLSKKNEIYYKGKNVSMGYAESYKDLRRKDVNKGLLKTGDLAFKDKDGFFYITGRKSRDIKLHGHRINLNEIEILLKKNMKTNCYCINNKNKIVIFLNENEKNSNFLLNKLSNITNLHISNFELKFLKKIPRTSNGKVSYKKLQESL